MCLGAPIAISPALLHDGRDVNKDSSHKAKAKAKANTNNNNNKNKIIIK